MRFFSTHFIRVRWQTCGKRPTTSEGLNFCNNKLLPSNGHGMVRRFSGCLADMGIGAKTINRPSCPLCHKCHRKRPVPTHVPCPCEVLIKPGSLTILTHAQELEAGRNKQRVTVSLNWSCVSVSPSIGQTFIRVWVTTCPSSSFLLCRVCG